MLHMFTRVYLFLIVLDNLCFPMFSRFTTFTRVFLCLPMFNHAHLCLPLFIHACLPMFTHIYLGLPIFTHVYSVCSILAMFNNV